MKLYNLPRDSGVKIYHDDIVIIFGHLDGAYSYSWLEGDEDTIIHLRASTELEEYKDGYRIAEE